MLAVLDHPHLFTHAPFTNHSACDCGGSFYVAPGAIGDITKNNLLGDSSAHADGKAGKKFILPIRVLVLFREPHRRTERRSSWDNRDLVERLSVFKQFQQ